MTYDHGENTDALFSKLRRFYEARIEEHGLTYAAMWGDENSSKSYDRFMPLLQLPLKDGDILVDVGCGIGDLAGFLKQNNLNVRYVGIEAVPLFAKYCRELYGVEVMEFDAFQDHAQIPAADWIVSFGTLNKKWSIGVQSDENHVTKIEKLIHEFFILARKGVAFSCVTDKVEFKKNGVCHCDPTQMTNFLSNLTPHFLVFHGYTFYEFFAALWRGERR